MREWVPGFGKFGSLTVPTWASYNALHVGSLL